MADSDPSGLRGGGGAASSATSATAGLGLGDAAAPLLPQPHPHRHPHRRGASARSIPLRIGRRLMRRQPSAAEALQLDGRYSDWGYSGPVVTVDALWNLASVLVAASVLLRAAEERPSTPINAWVFGYALQCLMHVGFVCFEYRRQMTSQRRVAGWRSRWLMAAEILEEDELEESRLSRAVKKLEALNAMISLLWWMLGFYWIVVGGQELMEDAPYLYWLTVLFLAFDVFFAIICIMLACVIGIAFCCCMPCMITFLYAVLGQEGANDADLRSLPKFLFRRANQQENFDLGDEHGDSTTIREQESMFDLVLSPEYSECCICLSQYEDGVELHSLPCNHHFHSDCILKWLRINSTCPLCKHDIHDNIELV